MINLAEVSSEAVDEAVALAAVTYAEQLGQSSDVAAGWYSGFRRAVLLIAGAPELMPLLERAARCDDPTCPNCTDRSIGPTAFIGLIEAQERARQEAQS